MIYYLQFISKKFYGVVVRGPNVKIADGALWRQSDSEKYDYL